MATVTEHERDWLSTPQAARRIQKSKDFVRKLVKEGKLTIRQINTRWEISRQDLDQLAAESIRPANRHSGTATSPQPSA